MTFKILKLTSWVACVLLAGLVLVIKIDVLSNGKLTYTSWNDKKTCVIEAYGVRYSHWGIPGSFIGLLSGRGYYQLRNKEGKLLRSSVWIPFQRDFPGLEGTYWEGAVAQYATSDGLGYWFVPECR